jgi:hypothetical protein
MATYHCSIKAGNKGSGASGSAKADYICREGKYADKPDLEFKESGSMPEWAQDTPRAFWQAGDEYERANGRVYTEIEIALPREISPEQRQELVKNFIKEQLPNHPYTVAIHNPKAALEGGEQPHAHIIFSERKLDGIERDQEQFFKRAAAPYRDRKTKEMVTPDPAKGGAKKDLSWHKAEKIVQTRESWEQHYNRYSPEQVSCRSLKAQGVDREPECHLGPTLARTAAADKIIETRSDRQQLEEIEREMVKLSSEIETQDMGVGKKPAKQQATEPTERKTTKKQDINPTPEQSRRADPDELAGSSRNTTSSKGKAKEKARLDQAKQPPQVMTASDMLNEAWAHSKTLEALDTARSEALHELRKQKEGLSLPYREEAIKRHVTQKWQPHWEKLNKKVENYNSCLKVHEEAGILTKVGWDLGKSYNKAADRLTREAVTLKYEQKQLKEYEAREKEELGNPHNIHAHGKHEVDKLAHKLAQERDPDYQNKKAAIERQEEKIIAARQISQPEIKRVRELCRHLAKLDSQQQVTLTMPLDRILKSPDIVNRLNQGFEKRDKAVEHDKTIKRDHGVER